jgi:hypothetical protein
MNENIKALPYVINENASHGFHFVEYELSRILSSL